MSIRTLNARRTSIQMSDLAVISPSNLYSNGLSARFVLYLLASSNLPFYCIPVYHTTLCILTKHVS